MTEELANGKRLYRIDLVKLDRLLIQARMKREGFLRATGISNRTATRIWKKEPMQLSTVIKVAEGLGVGDLSELVITQDLTAQAPTLGQRIIGDFIISKSLGVWETAANTLQYRIYKLEHRFLPGRLARGKRYDLSELSQEDRNDYLEQFRRHPTVCAMVGHHPNIATNITATQEGNGDWWVIDEWVEGNRLSAEMDVRRFSASESSRIARELAEGLSALHQAGVVRRELSPYYVLLEEGTNRAVMTEFELAKLTDGRPTVSNSSHWPIDRYRAPEVIVNGASIDGRADIFSWGRLVIHLVSGMLPNEGEEAEAIKSARIPSKVRDLLVACVEQTAPLRPANIKEVLTGIAGWR